MSKGPEANLWQSMRKSLPKGMNPTRFENRHGGGVPDLELQWSSGSAFVELKAPRSTPKTVLQTLQIRPYLFAKSENDWAAAMSKGLTFEKLNLDEEPLEFTSRVQGASLASNDQKAWHARRYANGGLSFFLQSTVNKREKLLLSPFVDRDSAALRLGLVCESCDWEVIWYALRLCSELHCLAALRR